MSVRSMLVALAALALATPLSLGAQNPFADVPAARRQFVAGQMRDAANTLLTASLLVRQEVGRSHDEIVGMKLYDAEGQLEKLAARLRAGAGGGLTALDRTLTQIDVLLAQHHLQVASAGIAKPNNADLSAVAKDVDLAAFHFERSITLTGRTLSDEQSAATNGARTLAKTIVSTKSIPADAPVVVATLEKLVLGTTVVAVAP